MVSDTTPPVITLTGDEEVHVLQNAVYVDASAEATDDVDGDVSLSIVTGGDTVDTSAAGAVYLITYSVSDAAGNPAIRVTRTVIIDGESNQINPFELYFCWLNYLFFFFVKPFLCGGTIGPLTKNPLKQRKLKKPIWSLRTERVNS